MCTVIPAECCCHYKQPERGGMSKKAFSKNGRYTTDPCKPNCCHSYIRKPNSPIVDECKPKTYSKPITFSNYHVHRHHKKNTVSQISNFDRLKSTQPKGLVFVWPKRRKFYYHKELAALLWSVSHALYWMHIVHLFPNGAGLCLQQPPWNYKPPLPKPQNRDYIIEPDWDSTYT